MRVDVLGPVAVHGAGTTGSAGTTVSGLALGGRRARVVLVALAVSGGPVPAERLARLVWGDELPSTWTVALRGVVRGLRTACEPAGGDGQRLIATVPSGYQLADGVLVDVTQAARDVARAAGLLAEGRHRAVLELAEPVTRLAGDQLLPGEDGDWIGPVRHRVDATALRAVLLLAEASSQLSDHHRAVAAVRRALTAYPLEESLHRALIAALDRSGDRAGAVLAYEQCRAVLGDQLGVDPSPETVQVYLAALRDQAVSGAAPVPVPATSFIGRDREVRTLSGLLTKPGLVTVTGPGGVGKSRLAAQVAGSRVAGSRVAGSQVAGRRRRPDGRSSPAAGCGYRSPRWPTTRSSPPASRSRSGWRSAPTTRPPRSPITSRHSAGCCWSSTAASRWWTAPRHWRRRSSAARRC